MAKKKAMKQRDKVMIAEHVLEVRHEPSGTFLDMRGKIADYFRSNKLLPHWSIDNNSINFRDTPNGIKLEGAFIGYKNAGYIVLNPHTHNYFTDKVAAFWKLFLNNKQYDIPNLIRFGARTKIFVPSNLSFDRINSIMHNGIFSSDFRTIVGKNETDLQYIVVLKESGFEMRIAGGPFHQGEAENHFQFKAKEFSKCGLFFDIDVFRTDDLKQTMVPTMLRDAVKLTWDKAERIATGLGF